MIVANAESLRRDSAGLIDESCLTPRSLVLRDRVAHELRLDVIKQKYPERPPEKGPPWNLAHQVEVAEVDPLFDDMRLSRILEIYEQVKSSREAEGNEQKQRKTRKTTPAQIGEETMLLISSFHKVLVTLLSDHNCWYRLAAIEALTQPKVMEFASEFGTEMALTYSESMNDSFPLVRRFAVEGMGSLGHVTKEHCRDLRLVAEVDSDRRVRAEAAKALARLGMNGMLELARCLQESDFWPVRSQICLALGAMPEDYSLTDEPDIEENPHTPLVVDARMAMKILKATLKNDKLPGVRESAAEALGRLGVSALPAVTTLIKRVKDEDLRVRIAVVRALGKVISQAAPSSCQLAYHDLMRRGNTLEKTPEFCDTLRLTCRALSSVLRDREPLLKNAQRLYDLENQQLDGFLTPDRSARRVELRSKERERLLGEGGHVRGLFRAGEESLQLIGAYAWPSIIARLIEEDNHGLGFASRMAILRALHCAASRFASEELVNSMLSEWVATPDLTRAQYPTNINAVANTLPVRGVQLRSHQHFSNQGISWATLHEPASGELIMLFGIQADSSAGDLLQTDKCEVTHAELTSGTSLPVHRGIWNLLDAMWAELLQLLCNDLEDVFESRSSRRLRICGTGLGGAFAKMVAIRLHCEETLQVGPEGLTVLTFGSPNIVAMADGEVPALSAASPRSRCWQLVGDPLPDVLGSNREKVVKHYRTRSILLCGRRRYSVRQGGFLYNSVTSGAAMPAHSWGSLFVSEQVKPVMRERPETRTGMENSFDETLNDAKCYTNALCWKQLESLMPCTCEFQQL